MNNNYNIPDLDEASASQIPAVIQLINLGYNYLSREEIKNKRANNNSRYILHDIAFNAIRKINNNQISDASINEALVNLEKFRMDDGVFKASEDIYTSLVAGCAVQELIYGKKVSPQLKFIDFENPLNNIFHVTVEFEIYEEQDRRPDIVLFVNGIPMGVIENKKPSVPVKEAITQMYRNQQGSQIPKFFLFQQILAATNMENFKYGTMLTQPSFFSDWKIREDDGIKKQIETEALKSQNKKIDTEVLNKLLHDLKRSGYVQKELSLKPQIIGIFCLFAPETFLDIIRNFIIYDSYIKKIARYQQFYVIKKILRRINTFDEKDRRNGGIIWHTQGTGKSLTMVMLVKNLTEIFNNPRIIVVTDRRDLDRQIRDTFDACNIKKDVTQTLSAENLKTLIKNKSLNVITTLIHKFGEMKEPLYVDNDKNIFVLVDEAHRTQSGEGREKMLQMLPNACVLGFTGTPLKVRQEKAWKKSEKDITINQFGGLIDAYTISEAEKDGMVLPLVYQGLFVEQDVNSVPVDSFFERIAKDLTPLQKKELSRQFLSSRLIEETSQRIDMIAANIHKHFTDNFLGTGLKGQAVLPSKYTAVIFKQALDLLGGMDSAVIISDVPGIEEDADDNIPEHKKEVSRFIDEIKRRYGSLEHYEKDKIASFKKDPDGCQLIICVDKLLTGFDAPVNTVLYLAKQLKDHNLLQAIARVNRIYEGNEKRKMKVNGLIFDYSKNAKNLKDALELFSKYDPKDIERALINTDDKIDLLNKIYNDILSVFKDIKNKDNYDDYVSLLKNNEFIRKEFYQNVNSMIKELDVCRSLNDFYEKIDAEKLKKYSLDLKRFIEIKKITQTAMSENVDFSKYEDQIRKILNRYVTAYEVEELSAPIELNDVTEFNEYIENAKNGLSDKSKAEAIAAQTQRTISARYEQDPVFYAKFSERIKNLIAELKIAKQQDLAELLANAKKIQKEVENYEDSDVPEIIRKNKNIHPYFRYLRNNLKELIAEENIINISEDLLNIIKKEKIVDWKNNTGVKRTVINNLEDYFFDSVKYDMNIPLTAELIESLVENIWNLAVQND